MEKMETYMDEMELEMIMVGLLEMAEADVGAAGVKLVWEEVAMGIAKAKMARVVAEMDRVDEVQGRMEAEMDRVEAEMV